MLAIKKIKKKKGISMEISDDISTCLTESFNMTGRTANRITQLITEKNNEINIKIDNNIISIADVRIL